MFLSAEVLAINGSLYSIHHPAPLCELSEESMFCKCLGESMSLHLLEVKNAFVLGTTVQ